MNPDIIKVLRVSDVPPVSAKYHSAVAFDEVFRAAIIDPILAQPQLIIGIIAIQIAIKGQDEVRLHREFIVVYTQLSAQHVERAVNAHIAHQIGSCDGIVFIDHQIGQVVAAVQNQA